MFDLKKILENKKIRKSLIEFFQDNLQIKLDVESSYDTHKIDVTLLFDNEEIASDTNYLYTSL